ncbi:MAG: hypothetical protein IT158_23335 [Bryobacterales bacterium]|nr:hypothetical protein [Bryobacterales bacterium]
MRLLLSLCLVTIAAGADFLPLQTGNRWTYRESGGHTFTVRVGVPAVINDTVYYRLTGYTREPVWVRSDESGALYYRDEEANFDVLLTSFESPFAAPLRPCLEQGRPEDRRPAYSGPAGRFPSVKVISYEIQNCADAGVESEQYLENLGMLRRVESSIAGPRTYDLVDARVGSISISESPYSSFRVTAAVAGPALKVNLRLSVDSGTGLKLTYLSSQDYDLALRNPNGETIYRWSAARLFLPVVRERVVVGELLHEIEVPLSEITTRPLEPGTYTVEAWITSGSSGREFSASAALEIPDKQ